MDGSRRTYGKHKYAYNILITKPNEKDNLKDLGVNGRMILKLILK
jgi:hypothetical protein